MRAVVSAWILGCTLLIGAAALAEEAPGEAGGPVETTEEEESPAEARAAQFVGVTGPEAESVPGGALLLGAYAVVWVLLFLFLLRMRRLQRHTAEELERLSAELRASEAR